MMTDNDNNEDGGEHPLLNSLILYNLLNFFPATDVESYRLVCKAWNTEACWVLRNKRIIVFEDPDAVRLYNDAMWDKVELANVNFEFCIHDFTGFVDENLREFWTTFGPSIKALEFRQTYLYWCDFLDVILQNVPNLQKIAFRHLPRNLSSHLTRPSGNDASDGGGGAAAAAAAATMIRRRILSVRELHLASIPANKTDAVDRLADVLKTFPNLRVIKFLPLADDFVRAKVSDVFFTVLQKDDVSLPQLRKVLNLDLGLSTASLRTMMSKAFPLQTLQITLLDGINANDFVNLMNMLAPTLHNLQVSFPKLTFARDQMQRRPPAQLKEGLQVLVNLKKLQMYNLNNNFKGSIQFVRNLTKLETLEITTRNMVRCIPFRLKGIKESHQLKRFKILSTLNPRRQVAKIRMLESISRCFPCLNAIHLHGVDDDGLGVIYRKLSLLSDVELTMSRCTDQGLTGIPLCVCHDMLETEAYIRAKPEEYRRDLSIGSLQYLRRFCIDAPQISNASIALGLVDCKNLRELHISSPYVTDAGVIFIADNFGEQLNLLNVSRCMGITETGEFYAREKLAEKVDVVGPTTAGRRQRRMVTNPNRVIINPKRSATRRTELPVFSSHSKYSAEDIKFFEEEVEEIGALGFGNIHFPLHFYLMNPFFMLRYRTYLRRKFDFMRSLRRIGVQEFCRLYQRALQDILTPAADTVVAVRGDLERSVEVGRELPLERRRNIHHHRIHVHDVDSDDDEDEILIYDEYESSTNDDYYDDDAEDEQQQQQLDLVPDNENENGGGEVKDEPENDAPERPPSPFSVDVTRLPDVHVAELLRIGLRPEAIEALNLI